MKVNAEPKVLRLGLGAREFMMKVKQQDWVRVVRDVDLNCGDRDQDPIQGVQLKSIAMAVDETACSEERKGKKKGESLQIYIPHDELAHTL